jgi:hypothetical protein
MTCLSDLKQIPEYEEWSNILSEQNPVTEGSSKHFKNMTFLSEDLVLSVNISHKPLLFRIFLLYPSFRKYFCIASDLKTETVFICIVSASYGTDN